jgi:hypothetical protein
MPYQSLAIRSEEALFEARGERLRGYFHKEELQALGITEDVAIKAINEVLSPALASYKPDRNSRQFSEVQAQYYLFFQVSKGASKSQRAAVAVTITDKGPRVLISDLIGTEIGIIISGVGKENESAWKEILTKQAKQLKELGIRGYWHLDSNRIDEWPEYSGSRS